MGNDARIYVIAAAAVCGQILAVYLTDFPYWVPLTNILFSAGLYAERFKAPANFVLTAGHFGLCLAVVLLAWPLWLPLTGAVLGVALVVKRWWGF